MLILDGVYTQGPDGPRFHRVTAPDTKTLEHLLNRFIQRIVRRLSRPQEKDGLLIENTECSGQLIPDTVLSFSSATAGGIPSLN